MPKLVRYETYPEPPQRARKMTASKGATLGFEDKLWQAADLLRGSMDPSEYKHVVLGLIFLKYISDAFEQRRMWLLQEAANPASDHYVAESSERYSVADERDAYTEVNVFWVPERARWTHLQAKARDPEIGRLIDDAMRAIEQANPSLKDVLPRDYARPSLDKQRLGQLVDLVATIGLGDDESRSKDILGRVYEYFLGKFAGAEGKGSGEHYTPRSVVRLLVEMIEPYSGRVYDPCYGRSRRICWPSIMREAAQRPLSSSAMAFGATYGRNFVPLCLSTQGIMKSRTWSERPTVRNTWSKDRSSRPMVASHGSPPSGLSEQASTCRAW